MDFFEHQAKANKSSKYLIISYLVALLVITLGFNLAGLLVWAMATQALPIFGGEEKHTITSIIALWMDTRYSWQVTVSVVLFVGIVSVSNWLSLRQGGAQVAKMMGGRRIPVNTYNQDEKRLLNVVEEMAIAAGLPVPEVFVMDREHAINAFAAGYSPNEAAISVTRGLLINLNRDELQGVIGHEFSHILNGDMRLNIRMISVLSGLVAMGQLGRWMIELAIRGGHDSKGGIFFLLVPGLLIWLIGSLGVVCSRIIKAALSRQREYLADASAVQFTRQTQGIASALYKIHTHRYESLLTSRHAEDLSHMCIAKTLNMRFASLLATHPPMADRITRLDKSFLTKAKIQAAQLRTTSTVHGNSSAATQPKVSQGETAGQPSAIHGFGASIGDTINQTSPSELYGKEIQPDEMIEFSSPFQQASVDQAIASIGLTDQSSIEAAQQCLANLPDSIIMGLRQPDYASLILLLLLVQANSNSEAAIEILTNSPSSKNVSPQTRESTALPRLPNSIIEHYYSELNAVIDQPIYPLLQLGIATLKPSSEEEKQALLASARLIIQSDKQISPQELFLYLVLFRHFNPKASRNPKVEFSSFAPIEQDLINLFGFLSRFTDKASQDEVFLHALQPFNLCNTKIDRAENITHGKLADAIFRVEHLAPMLKRSVLTSVIDLIKHDQLLTYQEQDWLRMLADCWDCPVPIALNAFNDTHVR